MTKFKPRKGQNLSEDCTAKPHAHLQTLTKAHAKIQKDPGKIVGGRAFTRYPMSLWFGRN